MHLDNKAINKFSLTSLFLAVSLFCLSTCPAKAGLFSFLHHKHKQDNDDLTNNQTSDNQTRPSNVPTYYALRSKRLLPYPLPAHQLPTNQLPANQIKPHYSKPLYQPNQPPKKQLDNSNQTIQSQAFQSHSQAFYSNQTIRIGLALNVSNVELTAVDGAEIIDPITNQTIAQLPAQTSWSATNDNQVLVFKNKDKQFYNPQIQLAQKSAYQPVAYYPTVISPQTAQDYTQDSTNHNLTNSLLQFPFIQNSERKSYYLKPISSNNQEGIIAYNGKLYRGTICLQPSEQSASFFNVINILNLEDYLLSVVPSEMPSGWPQEALKAQTIAARSYALANLGKHGSDGYDLKDNTEDQVYSGIKSEYASTNQAVASTQGLVLEYDGKPICAYFHSTSGGGTDSAENIWGRAVPYLKAVADYDDSSPMFTWNRQFSIDELERKLGSVDLISLAVLSRTDSQRVNNLLVMGRSDAKLLSGEKIRGALNLPSANFNVFPSANSYLFYGRGFGHGLGLSQWGAKTLAEQGYNAAQILTYYYKDVTIERLTAKPAN